MGRYILDGLAGHTVNGDTTVVKTGPFIIIACLLIPAIALALTVSPAFAHPGNTAADGCHYCRTNCAKWGAVEGERHCHGARQSGGLIEKPQPRAEGRGLMGESPRPPASSLSGVPRIIDADTLELSKQKVRLQGIDAPESAQTCRLTGGRRYQCGNQATAALRTRLGQGAVRCTIESRDPLRPRARDVLHRGRGERERLARATRPRPRLSALFD